MYGRAIDFDIIDAVTGIAAQRGVRPAQVALAWHLHKPGIVAPIVGATRTEHITDAVAATHLQLGDEETTALEQLYRPRDVID